MCLVAIAATSAISSFAFLYGQANALTPATLTSPTFSISTANNAIHVYVSGDAGAEFKDPAVAAKIAVQKVSGDTFPSATYVTSSDKKSVDITGFAGVAGTYRIVADAEAFDGGGTSLSVIVDKVDVTASSVTINKTHNCLTVALPNGTYVSSISGSNFSFSTEQTALRAGTYVRKTSSLVEITGFGGIAGDVIVTVKANAMATADKTAVASPCTRDVSATVALNRYDTAIEVTLTKGKFSCSTITTCFDINPASWQTRLQEYGAVESVSDTVRKVTLTSTAAIDPAVVTITVRATAMSEAAASVAAVGTHSSTPFSLTTSDNGVEILIDGTTFKALEFLSPTQFTFLGSSSSALQLARSAGTLKIDRDSGGKKVTLFGVSGLSGTNNTVSVSSEALTSDAALTGVSASGTTHAVTSAASSLASGTTQVFVTLRGGTYRDQPTFALSGGFSFSGSSSGSATRLSSTVAMFTVSGITSTTYTVTVPAGWMDDGAYGVLLSAVPADLPTSTSGATLTSTQNSVTISLSSGASFRSGSLSAADFAFSGASAGLIAAGAFERLSDTAVTVKGLAGLSGSDNKVTVLGRALASRGTGVAATLQGGASVTYLTSAPFSLDSQHNKVTITLTSGTFRSGTMSASDFQFSGDSSVALAGGTFSRASSTVVTISGVSGLTGSNNVVAVKSSAMDSPASSVSGLGGSESVTSGLTSLQPGATTATITLVGGKFRTGSVSAANFIFAGSSKAALELGTFTRVSDTVVTISGLVGLTGSNNTVTVPVATMPSNAASGVTFSGGPVAIAALTSSPFFMLPSYNSITITLTGGTFKSGSIGSSDFTFAGTDANAFSQGTFVRNDSSSVTVSGVSGLSGVNNTVTVKSTTLATQATAVVAVGAINALTSAPFALLPTNNAIAVTLAGGAFSDSLTSADFSFTGPNAIELAAAGINRLSDTLVVFNGLGGIVGVGNTVTIKTSAMFLGALSATVTNVIVSSPAGSARGLAKPSAIAAKRALTPIVTLPLSVVPSRAPATTVKVLRTVAPRVTGLTAGSTYSVKTRIGTVTLTLGRVTASGISTKLPAVRVLKKGTYYLQLTDSVGKQFYLKVVGK